MTDKTVKRFIFNKSYKTRKTIELFKNSDAEYLIEVDNYKNNEVEHIGIWTDNDNSMKIMDYDGVFFVDDEEIKFLKDCGFDTSEIE